MRTILGCVLILALAPAALADPLVIHCTDRDETGTKYEKNVRKLTIQMVYSSSLQKRLIQFLKTQDLRDREPWRPWDLVERKDGDAVTYVVFVNVTPNFTRFRMTNDGPDRKTFVVDGHASFNGMQAPLGRRFPARDAGRRDRLPAKTIVASARESPVGRVSDPAEGEVAIAKSGAVHPRPGRRPGLRAASASSK